MPIRSLCSMLLLAVFLTASVSSASAAATSKAPTAKIALGAKHKAKAKKAQKAKKAKKAKRARKAKKAAAARRSAAKTSVSTRPAPAALVECANTTIVPDAGNLELVRAALVCLHNQIREQNGLGTLAENGALAAAAATHSDDMVRRDYFAHDTPEGGTFVDRIIAARYAGRNAGWTLGENLAWGTGDLSTPAALMNSWMNSPGHRDNILKADFQEFGLGLRVGTPTGADYGVTVSAEFGAHIL